MSSNAFANGSNQNCGNVMTGRSTTRIHAPPGGKSSFNIFGGSSAPAPARAAAVPIASTVSAASYAPKTGTSSNAFSSGSNQNCGNVITDRSTTRIHAPPGGKQSFNIFGAPAPTTSAPSGRTLRTSTQTNVVAAPAATTYTAPIKRTGPRQGGTSSNAFATGSNQNCGNVITDRSSTRIHQPPGGRSSGPLW